MLDTPKRRRFLLFLVKPSHYDDDGYVIQWMQVGAAVQFARLPLRHRQGRDGERGARPRRRRRDLRHRRDQHPRPPGPDRPPDRGRGRPRPRRLRRRPVEPVPAGDGLRAAAAGGRDPRLHRRLPCLRLSRDAEGDARFAERGARPRHFAVRRRGRGAVRRRAARRRGGHAEADLQLPRRPAGPRRRDRIRSCRASGSAARSA